MKKKLFCLFLAIVIFLSSVNLIYASFVPGVKLENIDTNYSAGESLKGWINISLQQEPAKSQLTAFDSSMTILELLENNNLDEGDDFNCSVHSCIDDYQANNEETSKSFDMDYGWSKLVGLRLDGELASGSSPIIEVKFQLASDAQGTCYNPLQIDFLNDNIIDWYFNGSANDFTCTYSTGCFSISETLEEGAITTTKYCEKINLEALPSFQVGANITKGTTAGAVFKMRVYGLNMNEFGNCDLPADPNGTVSCIVNLNLKEKGDYYVCVNADKTTDYKIKAETVAPCGFAGSPGSFTTDYNIFARGGKYSNVGSFTLNQNDALQLKSKFNTYITRYNRDCSNGCIIPIKFLSQTNQRITLSNLVLQYQKVGLTTSTDKFYDANTSSAKINMPFLKLSLDGSNLTVPTSPGTKSLSLKLNGNTIVSKSIVVKNVSNIIRINTNSAVAAVSTKFIVYTTGNITSYKWTFGDNSSSETITSNSTFHTYASLGTYTLKIEVTDNLGGKSSKEFSISVNSPKEIANLTIASKRKRIANLTAQLNSITGWYKSEIEKAVDIDGLDAELVRLENAYKAASSSSEYTTVMQNLNALKIPYSISVTESSQGVFFPSSEQINPSYLENMGAGEVDAPDSYKNAILSWFNENLNVNAENKVYGLNYYDEEPVSLLTYVKLKISPKKDYTREVYLIIEEDFENVKFNPSQTYKSKKAGDATGITFSELSEGEEKVVEFILPEKTNIINLPVYLSPEFSKLTNQTEIEPCDFDGKCEKEQDENWKNCRNDCKPWGTTILFLFLLLFIAFVVYIILQEWYKRRYESHLFRNRNDLFNLINFISNALNQGFSREDIIKRLEKHGWKREQIIYAFKKVLGERTGMWEIPIFRWFEKRKIKEEIEKRQRAQMSSINKQM